MTKILIIALIVFLLLTGTTMVLDILLYQDEQQP